MLASAIEQRPTDGGELVKALVDQLRAHSAFRESAEAFAGAELISSLRSAFRSEGFDLDAAKKASPGVRAGRSHSGRDGKRRHHRTAGWESSA